MIEFGGFKAETFGGIRKGDNWRFDVPAMSLNLRWPPRPADPGFSFEAAVCEMFLEELGQIRINNDLAEEQKNKGKSNE